MFVDFLVTKHGLAEVLGSDDTAFQTLHAYFIDRLVPVCEQLLEAAAAAGEIRPGQDGYELLRGVGNLCVGADRRSMNQPATAVAVVAAAPSRLTGTPATRFTGYGGSSTAVPGTTGARKNGAQ
jgi:hypothetical protein